MPFLSAETFRNIVSGRRQGLLAAAVRGCCAAAEPLYGYFVARKNRQFDSGARQPVRVAAPVISVGNLTVGGTGKTPLVIWLAKWFREQGREVVLISRGYGQRHGPNDEALEIAATLPGIRQLQSPDRVAAAREALAQPSTADPPVLILDDAFQHRRIARDLDIVLIDALEPFGYGRLLPRGLLREPMANLARAQVVALSRADAVSRERREELQDLVAKLAPQATWLELTHAPLHLLDNAGNSEPLAAWQGKKIAAFAGIGNPVGFEHTLRNCGLNITAFRALADHQAYTPAIVSSLETWLRSLRSIDGVVCTFKDFVKLPQADLGGLPLLALQIELQIEVGESKLSAKLTPFLNSGRCGS